MRSYPELGNTGVNADDQEADRPHAQGDRPPAGAVAQQLARTAARALDGERQLVGISGLDTRALVRHLREVGAMNGVICTDGRALPSCLS